MSRPVLEDAAQLVEMDTVSLVSVSSFGDDDEEIELSSVLSSISSSSSLPLSR